MILINEIKEAKTVWKNASLLLRAYIVLSVFLVSGSIASLADIVFAWKGFILDGIELYNSIINIPFINLLNLFDIKITKINANSMIMFLILFGALIRGVLAGASKDKTKRIILLLGFVITLEAYALITAATNTDISHFNALNNPTLETILYNMFALIIVAIYAVSEVTRDAVERVHTYIPLLIAISTTLILGAINSGLSR